MRILLTGANGFTGRPFAEAARAAGRVVVPLKANLADRDALRHEVLETRPDAVVHLAAISFVGHADDGAFYAVNTVGTCNLLVALAALPNRPQKVLLASSANVYGNCDASPIDETQPPAPVNHYAMSKLAMEHMARTYANRLPLVITRPFNYTGPGQNVNFVIPKLVDHFARKAASIALGNLHVEREFNDVQMVCNAYLQLLEHGEPGEAYNVCSGQPYTLQHVIDTLSRITGHAMHVEVNPAFVRANEVHRLCGSPAKLQALLVKQGYASTNPPLEDTLQRMLSAAGA
ncbi:MULTISPECIES: GDP-mannose 4,6-dehydratase [Diaphorobacter]|uniref:NAD-dependent epimerase/dehydratase n=1 Tax=Acidovorax ebreus (strain TPSY) TaxID=535289 RepID=A0A9J9Q7W8_ACIET|nr:MULTISPECIES: GDP-mannose 4,6-dehydratase [Diaphorobacter]ACM32040.1 NAD-dependent epimerase/dehydratase [[Acidovorax] ebreus TPSY]